VRLKTSPPSLAECHEIWEPETPGTLWDTPGLLRDCFTFTFFFSSNALLISAEFALIPKRHDFLGVELSY
jgi:hypothetical protein